MWRIRAPDHRLVALLVLVAGVWAWQAGTRTATWPLPPTLTYAARGSGTSLRCSWTIRGVALSPDGRALALLACEGPRRRLRRWKATASDEGETALMLWRVAERRVAWVAPSKVSGGTLRFSADGARLAVGSGSPRDATHLRLYDVRSGRVVCEMPGGGYAAAFSPDGRTVAGLEGDRLQFIVLYDAETGRIRRLASLPPTVDGRDVAFSPDGSVVAVSTLDLGPPGWASSVWLWDAATGRKLGGPVRADLWTPLFFAGDRTAVVCGSELLEWQGAAVRRTDLRAWGIWGGSSPDGRLAYLARTHIVSLAYRPRIEVTHLELRELPANRIWRRWPAPYPWPPPAQARAGLAVYPGEHEVGLFPLR